MELFIAKLGGKSSVWFVNAPAGGEVPIAAPENISSRLDRSI